MVEIPEDADEELEKTSDKEADEMMRFTNAWMKFFIISLLLFLVSAITVFFDPILFLICFYLLLLSLAVFHIYHGKMIFMPGTYLTKEKDPLKFWSVIAVIIFGGFLLVLLFIWAVNAG